MEEYINKINSEKLKREILTTMNHFESLINYNYDNNNKYDLMHYANLLYFDTIPLKEFEELMKNPSTLLSAIKDPESIFESYFDKIFDEMQNSNNGENSLFKNKFKQALKIQYNDVQRKIKECDEHIRELNELYIQEELYLKVPLTTVEKKKFILKNKSVLVYTQSSNKYGELFARYIFTSIFSPQTHNNSTPDNFYNEEQIFDFLKNEYNEDIDVKPFKEWHILLKFWIIYVLIYEQMFSKESNIDDITSIQPLFKLAKNICGYKSKNEHKNKGKQKGQQGKQKGQQQGRQQQGRQQQGRQQQRQYGGYEMKNLKKALGKYEDKKQKQQQKGYEQSGEATKYKELMKKIIIKKTDEDKSFNDIMNDKVLSKKVESYYKVVYKYGENSIPLIFDPTDKDSNINLSKLILKKKHVKNNNNYEDKSEVIIKNLTEKIKIYQSLFTYKNTNIEEIKKFLNQLYKTMIYYYLFLYYKKKMIYTKYMNIFIRYSQKYNIIIANLKQNDKDENENKSNSERFIREGVNSENNRQSTFINKSNTNLYTKLDVYKKVEYKKIMDKILFLKEKKDELEQNKNQMNYDKKILMIEKMIYELLTEKHRLLHRKESH